MSNVLFRVGPFHITLLGVFSLLGVMAGLVILRHETRRKGIPEETVYNTALVALLSAVVGARLYFAIVFAEGGLLDRARLFVALNQGGLSIQGALIGGVLGAAVYLRRRSPGFWKMADAAAPAIILGQAIGRIGCDVFGVVASDRVWWAVAVAGRMLHPVQIYESMLNYLLFLLLWYLRGRTRREGELFLVYIIAFGFNRFVVEFFRVNPTALGSLSVAHVTAIGMTAAAFTGLVIRRRMYRTRPVSTGIKEATNFDVEHRSRRPRSTRRDTVPYIVVPLLMVGSILTYYGIYT